MRVIEPYKRFEDGRGVFLGIVNSGCWEEVNYVETKAGQVRGGHYHKETRELFFILDGEIDIEAWDARGGGDADTLSASKGAIVIVDPYEVHTFSCRTDCRWINVLSRRIDDQFHDIHRPEA
jgi:dTDP-4-dehydrorhamnose 3,5-epimerase-like enzyme